MDSNSNALDTTQHPIKVEVTVRHSHSHLNIRDHAIRAVQVFNKYSRQITSCRIVFDHQKHDKLANKIAEVIVFTLGKKFHSKSAAETYEKALDKSIQIISRQLLERKNILVGRSNSFGA